MLTTFAVLDGQQWSVVIVAIISLVGTIATVGYKYKNTEKRKDPNQVIFDQVNNFIAEQRKERDDLRQELKEVKEEMKRVSAENETLKDNAEADRTKYNDLEQKYNQLKKKFEKLRDETSLTQSSQ